VEDDLKLQDFDQWVKIFILKHEGENLSEESKISGHPITHGFHYLTNDSGTYPLVMISFGKK